MSGYFAHLEDETVSNSNFRRVLFTAKHSQLVLMALKPGEEIGMETHPDNDQFFRFDQGEGEVVVDGEVFGVRDGDAVMVPAGSEHNVVNTSAEMALKFYTIYAPAHHSDGTIHATREEAMAAEEAEE